MADLLATLGECFITTNMKECPLFYLERNPADSNVFYVLPSSLEQLARIFPGTPTFPISVEDTESLTASYTKPGEKRCT